MKDWQKRLFEEDRDLEEKKDRLWEFMRSAEFSGLDRETQSLLELQYHTQVVYLSILKRRMEKLLRGEMRVKTPSVTATARPTDDGYAGRGPSLGVQEEI